MLLKVSMGEFQRMSIGKILTCTYDILCFNLLTEEKFIVSETLNFSEFIFSIFFLLCHLQPHPSKEERGDRVYFPQLSPCRKQHNHQNMMTELSFFCSFL